MSAKKNEEKKRERKRASKAGIKNHIFRNDKKSETRV